MNRPTLFRTVRRAMRMRGFTLIELMITVAIVALLAAIALPAYQDSVWKGKRGEAKAAIMKGLQAEERYFTNNNAYIDPASLPAANRGAFPAFSADSASNSRYNMTYTACAGSTWAQCVKVTATVAGTGPDPKCGTTLSMDSIGNKLPALTGSTAVCWK